MLIGNKVPQGVSQLSGELGVNNSEAKLLESAYKNSLELINIYGEIYPKQCLKVLDKYLINAPEEVRKKLRQEVLQETETYVKEHPIKTIAFPAISTGVYKFPLDEAAEIALNCFYDFLKKNSNIEKIIAVCFDKQTYECYINRLKIRE